MANPTPQVDPVHFPNLFSVYHVHDYAFATPRIIGVFALAIFAKVARTAFLSRMKKGEGRTIVAPVGDTYQYGLFQNCMHHALCTMSKG